MGCNNVSCTSLPLTCSLHPRLGQHGGWGWGWGGVGWGAITFLRSARSLDVHPLSTSIYLLTASTSWSAWGFGGGVGWGATTFLAHYFRLLAHASTSWSARGVKKMYKKLILRIFYISYHSSITTQQLFIKKKINITVKKVSLNIVDCFIFSQQYQNIITSFIFSKSSLLTIDYLFHFSKSSLLTIYYLFHF